MLSATLAGCWENLPLPGSESGLFGRKFPLLEIPPDHACDPQRREPIERPLNRSGSSSEALRGQQLTF